MSAKATFTCICLQKRLVLGNKVEKQKEQRALLEQIVEGSKHQSKAILPGGCIYASGLAVGEAVGFAAVVIGSLEGVQEVTTQYLPELAHPAVLQDAEIICHLYQKLGRMVPQNLAGAFSFVLFDSAQERVLAAVSPTSATPLLQARDAAGNLILTTQSPSELPSGSHSMLMLSPGQMKYGWSSDPQQYSTLQPESPPTASGRAQAARLALCKQDSRVSDGLQGSQSSVQTSGPSISESEGGEPQSPAPKKTRRGKRGGRNQKLRAESLKRGAADELSRPSLDRTSLPSPGLSPRSFSSRADEQNWWRTNTPRQSLELPFYPSTSGAGLCGSAPPVRRFSMSAAAPAFVPGQVTMFSRQSVPAVHSRTTALSFPERAKAPPPKEAFLSVPHETTTRISEEASMVSPFSATSLEQAGREPSPVGKADAAWAEDNAYFPSRPEAGDGLQRSSSKGRESTSEALPGRKHLAEPSGRTLPGREAGLPPLAVGGMGAQLETSTPEGRSPRGSSPGGSPRPPKFPLSNFKHFLKSMLPKRSSQVDLWAAAGTPAQDAPRSWWKSSSHGNLQGLQSAAPRDKSSLLRSSGEAHKVVAREDTARQSLGHIHDGSEDQMLHKLKLSEHEAQPAESHTSAAQWLADRTRNIFSKSKSCTDLQQIERAMKAAPAGVEVS